MAVADALHRGVADVLGSIEIRLPDAEIDYVDAALFECPGFGID
jgi:hypothetical protein